ncbi:MAG: hypothetical protein QM639_16655 [Rhodocyclaceae bacterium]
MPPGPYAAYAYRAPSADAERLRALPLPRWIGARWGEADAAVHWHYMAEDFSIASTESGYNTLDTAPLAISLGHGGEAPVMTWTLDGRGDYYGTARILEAGSGHLKALHLRPFISSVQRGSEVLFLASGGQDATSQRLDSTLILPADARLWLDGEALPVFTHRSAWRFEPAPDGARTRLDVVDTQGRTVLALKDDDPAAGLGVARQFAVEAGQTYRLRARVAGGPVMLYLNFYDAQGRLIEGEHMQRAGGGAEADYAFSQRAPAGAVRCRAWLYSSIAAQTEAIVSDLAFERLGPQGAEILGDFDFRAYRPQAIDVPAGATLVVQRGSAAVALRLLGARDTDGRAIAWRLYNDGLEHGALRLTAHHADGRVGGRGTVVVWAWARGGLDDAAAALFRRQASAARGDVDIDAEGVDARLERPGVAPLHLRADVARGVRLLREGGEGMPAGVARSVNGVPLPF